MRLPDRPGTPAALFRLTRPTAQSYSLLSVIYFRTLLVTLKREKLVLDWRKRQQSRAAVKVAIQAAAA